MNSLNFARRDNYKIPLDKGGKGDFQAFTLVELIVVVTILAILGLISFISIQGFILDTRDAKRLSDVSNLITKITMENSIGIEYSEIINEGGESYRENKLRINGVSSKNGYQNIENPINRDVLKENKENFSDPTNKHPYPFAYAVGNSNGQGYNFIQLAYVEEKTGTTKLVGNYYEMLSGDSPSLFTNTGSSGTNIPYDYITKNGEPIYDIGVTPPQVPQIVNSCATKPNYENAEFTKGEPTEANTLRQNVSSTSPCYYTCKENYSGTSCGTYTPPNGIDTSVPGEITITYNSISYTIADKNAGATSTDISICTTSSCPTSIAGNYYQFGTTTNSWISGSFSYTYDWKSPGGVNAGSANDWGVTEAYKFIATYPNSTSTNRTKMKGPCGTGYHVPTTLEWRKLIEAWFAIKGATCTLNDASTSYSCYFTSYNGATFANFNSDLKLPRAGIKENNSSIGLQGKGGYYRSSSPSGAFGFQMVLDDAYILPANDNNAYRAYGYSVRCFKDY